MCQTWIHHFMKIPQFRMRKSTIAKRCLHFFRHENYLIQLHFLLNNIFKRLEKKGANWTCIHSSLSCQLCYKITENFIQRHAETLFSPLKYRSTALRFRNVNCAFQHENYVEWKCMWTTFLTSKLLARNMHQDNTFGITKKGCEKWTASRKQSSNVWIMEKRMSCLRIWRIFAIPTKIRKENESEFVCQTNVIIGYFFQFRFEYSRLLW